MNLPFSIVILGLVFFFIMFRRFGNIRFQIWQIMTIGAILNLATFQISLLEAIKAINYEIIFFLIGMFIVGEALHRSGYIHVISYHFFSRADTFDKLLLYVIFIMGFLSAILMNDTIAIIGTAIVLHFAKTHNISSKILLLALAFSITVGSVMSPIGNPQNLLIASSKSFPEPFVNFFKYLFLPTIVNLFLIYFVLKIFYRKQFPRIVLVHEEPTIQNEKLARLSKMALVFIVISIGVKVVFYLLKIPLEFPLVLIALISGVLILFFSSDRWVIFRSIDWETILFFVAMFVVMQSAWNAQFFQKYIHQFNIHDLFIIFSLSIVLSQFISNVPLVMLFLGFLEIQPNVKEMISLAAASTIAGNLTVLGAASNVIIIQNAEKQNQHISSWEFSRVGLVLTLLNGIVYYFFLLLF
ncbi:MAG: SLC13 family permease [Leptospiraceae bacterium]|nr:SLC13 family permease [Leptospiraceae bacterium]MDW7975067.1 SLC13 family permease [Leptospiraceae bacterium]